MAMVKGKVKPSVHWIDDDDPAEVAALSRRCFGQDEAMTDEFIYSFMDARDHVPKILTVGKRFGGYNFFVLHKKIVVIHQLVVDRRFREKGFGSYMLKELIASLPGLRRHIIAAEMCETNLPSQMLFKSCGFTWFKTIPGEGGHDRYAFRYTRKD